MSTLLTFLSSKACHYSKHSVNESCDSFMSGSLCHSWSCCHDDHTAYWARRRRKEKLMSRNNFWEQFAKLWCEFLQLPLHRRANSEDASHQREEFTLLSYAHSTNTGFFLRAQLRVNKILSLWNDFKACGCISRFVNTWKNCAWEIKVWTGRKDL